MRTKKFLAMAIALGLAVGMTAMPTLAADKKTVVFGDTTFNAENEEADINPQKYICRMGVYPLWSRGNSFPLF